LLDVDATWTAVKEEMGKGSRKGEHKKRRKKRTREKREGARDEN
jgi:hypothetical protein